MIGLPGGLGVRQKILDYHQSSKHRLSGYAPSPGFLDWDSQPDPFRFFQGCEPVALPLTAGPSLSYTELFEGSVPAQQPSLAALGLLWELAAGLSAWKSADGARWSVRTVPSSGNLHPIESYILLWRSEFALPAGVYHYDAFHHQLECRAPLSATQSAALGAAYPDAYGVIGLSSLDWREEWKYGSRAFRYCQLDAGHALACLSSAARVCGWSLALDSRLTDADCAALMGLADAGAYGACEPEWPVFAAWLSPSCLSALPPVEPLVSSVAGLAWQGVASRVSAESVQWPEVALARFATVKADGAPLAFAGASSEPPQPMGSCEPGARGLIPAAELIRQRRSAQRMDPKQGMRGEDFQRLLRRLLGPGSGEAWSPMGSFPFDPALQVLMLVHDVSGLEPGLYALNRAPGRWQAWEAGQGWRRVTGALPLYQIGESGSLRREASQFSCFQGIAGRGAVTFVFVADMGEVLHREGAWAYRRLHWEAGALGQILYLEAEASGLRGTGIGCFMDDESLALSGHSPSAGGRWQVVYHFTIGHGVEDARVESAPPYGHRA